MSVTTRTRIAATRNIVNRDAPTSNAGSLSISFLDELPEKRARIIAETIQRWCG